MAKNTSNNEIALLQTVYLENIGPKTNNPLVTSERRNYNIDKLLGTLTNEILLYNRIVCVNNTYPYSFINMMKYLAINYFTDIENELKDDKHLLSQYIENNYNPFDMNIIKQVTVCDKTKKKSGSLEYPEGKTIYQWRDFIPYLSGMKKTDAWLSRRVQAVKGFGSMVEEDELIVFDINNTDMEFFETILGDLYRFIIGVSRGEREIKFNNWTPNDWLLHYEPVKVLSNMRYAQQLIKENKFNDYFALKDEERILDSLIGKHNYCFIQSIHLEGTTAKVLTIYSDVVGNFSINITVMPSDIDKGFFNDQSAYSWGKRYALRKAFKVFSGLTKDEVAIINKNREKFDKTGLLTNEQYGIEKRLNTVGLLPDNYISALEKFNPKLLEMKVSSDITFSKDGEEEGGKPPVPPRSTGWNIRTNKKPAEKKQESNVIIQTYNEADKIKGTNLNLEVRTQSN